MSLFFFIITAITYVISHLWAKKTQPISPTDFQTLKFYKGNLENFSHHLIKMVDNNPQWLLLEKTKTQFIISESPGAFRFGYFHHVQCKETKEGLEIKLTSQAKLVGASETRCTFQKHLTEIMRLKDVS